MALEQTAARSGLSATDASRCRGRVALRGQPGSCASTTSFGRVGSPDVLEGRPICQLVPKSAGRRPGRPRLGRGWLRFRDPRNRWRRSAPYRGSRRVSLRWRPTTSVCVLLLFVLLAGLDLVIEGRLGPHLAGAQIDPTAAVDRVALKHIAEVVEVYRQRPQHGRRPVAQAGGQRGGQLRIAVPVPPRAARLRSREPGPAHQQLPGPGLRGGHPLSTGSRDPAMDSTSGGTPRPRRWQ